MIRTALPAAAAAAGLALAPDAAASDPAACGRDDHPWVQIDAEGLPPSLGASVALLRAELASRGLDLCASGEGARPVATVRVAARPDGVALSVEVRDAVTDKQVSRDVPLSAIPADGRPLTVALAADELLRASWAELALKTAPPPARPVPPPVALTVRESLPSAPERPSPRVQFGVGLVLEQYARGLTLYGADARVGAWISRRVELVAGFGLRSGPAVAATDGTVQPSAWSASASGSITLTPPERPWGLDAIATLGVERLTLTPTPSGAATGSQESGYAFAVGGGPHVWFAVLPALRVGAGLLVIAPLRGVEAADGSSRFVGLGGPGWAGQVGLSSPI